MISDSGRYEQVHALFEAARALDPDPRRALLDERCADDAALRAEVEGLLAALESETLQPFVEQGIGSLRDSLEDLVVQPGTEDAPHHIANYRIEAPIGSGGVGVVYRATQESPRRTVALKLLRSGSASPDSLRRFRQEAELLGRLRHPGIAQIHEAGTFGEGPTSRPYLAMELVEGVQLTEFCRARHVPQRARLDLVARIADAVQHAHEAGVVHRDLKPENILVEPDGSPKILDFGIARAIEGSTVLTTQVTEDGDLLGTLAYMAPEQLEGRRELITPRVDVYALGAVLFELLSGRLPYDLAGLPLPAAIQLARETEPPLLGRLRLELRGDLETIVQKAMEREPARRYPTPAALAADLRAVIANRPIAARPPSRLYRAVKFTRRHRAFVAGTAATLAATLTGMAVSIVFALRAADNEARALHGEQIARAGVLQATQDHIERGDFAAAVLMKARAGNSGRSWESDLLNAALPEIVPAPYGAQTMIWVDSGTLLCATGGEMVVLDRETFSPRSRAQLTGEARLWPAGGLAITDDGSRMMWVGADSASIAHTLDRRDSPDDWGMIGSIDPSGALVSVRCAADGVTWTASRAGEPLSTLAPPPPAGSLFAIAPNGLLATCLTPDHSLHSYELATGLRSGSIQGLRSSSCRPIFFTEDSSRVFVYAPGNALLELDSVTLETLRVHDVRSDHGCSIGSLSQDGSSFAVDTSAGIAVTALETGEVLWIPKPAGLTHRERVQFSPDGRFLLARDPDIGSRIIDLVQPDVTPDQLLGPEDPRCTTFAGHPDFVHELAVSADGRMVASMSPPDDWLRVWDADTGAPIADLPKASLASADSFWDRGHHLSFSGDGRRLIASHQQGAERIQLWTWDVLESRQGLETLTPGLSGMSYLTLLDQHLELLDPGPPLRLGRTSVRTASGEALVTNIPSQTELPDGELWRGVPFNNADQGLALDPTGRYVALAAMREVSIRNLETWELLAELPGHVDSVAWSPTGDRIAAGTPEGRVRLIDAELRMELLSFQAHSKSVFTLAWTPDGTRLVTGSLDGTVKVWDPRPQPERDADREPYQQRLERCRAMGRDELEAGLRDADTAAERMVFTRVLLERSPGPARAESPAD